MTLAEINEASEASASRVLLSCCGSQRWAEQMLNRRPFASPEIFYEVSESIWCSLSSPDWLEAFAAHPKIGEQSPSRWSAQEQQGVLQGDADILNAIREMNSEYERQFGYIFIICATGKSAAEMDALLKQRLRNQPAAELRIAAGEQAKITRLRLGKLLAE